MRIETNAANRKDVVKAVSGILGEPSKYLGVPTCAYQIRNCTIDKKGMEVSKSTDPYFYEENALTAARAAADALPAQE